MVESIFESRTEKSKNKKFSFSIPADLHNGIEAINNELGEKAPDKKFNTEAICVAALEKAVKRARRELSKMSSVSSG